METTVRSLLHFHELPDDLIYLSFVAHGIDTGGGASKYFAENYLRLQRIKGKYDPDNVFNKWFAITPLKA